MNELPIWPPIVAFVIGLLVYLHGRWASRQFDRKYGRDPVDPPRPTERSR